MKNYKPQGYNCLSPYLVVDEAERLAELITSLFSAIELRKHLFEDGRIAHLELQIEDSVLMLSSSTEHFPANQTMLHVYVSDAKETFQKALALGCKSLREPLQEANDPDVRGIFTDFAGNQWAVSTQKQETTD